MDEEQRKRFEQAVERKAEASREASEHSSRQNPTDDTGATQAIQDTLINTSTTQDAFDPRDKNSQKGKKTADKWNQ